MRVDYDWGFMVWLLDGAEAKPAGFSQAKMVIRAGEKSETHTHGNCYEFFLVEEGAVTLVLDGTPHALKQGDHRLISPGVAHHVVAADQDATLTLTYSAAVREYTAVS